MRMKINSMSVLSRNAFIRRINKTKSKKSDFILDFIFKLNIKSQILSLKKMQDDTINK